MLFVLCVSGCASDPITVRVPVMIKCIEIVPERPLLLSDESLAALDDYGLVVSLAKDRRQRQAYEATIEAALEGCR